MADTVSLEITNETKREQTKSTELIAASNYEPCSRFETLDKGVLSGKSKLRSILVS